MLVSEKKQVTTTTMTLMDIWGVVREPRVWLSVESGINELKEFFQVSCSNNAHWGWGYVVVIAIVVVFAIVFLLVLIFCVFFLFFYLFTGETFLLLAGVGRLKIF